jgi:hypothetical protein
MTSHHPGDAEAGYCGNCHAFTGTGTGTGAGSGTASSRVPPALHRSLVAVEPLEAEYAGEARLLLMCDCGMATDLTIRVGRLNAAATQIQEAAVTCEGCGTAHWFTFST